MSNGGEGLLVAAEAPVRPICIGPEVVPLITLDVPAGGMLRLDAPVCAGRRGRGGNANLCIIEEPTSRNGSAS